MVCVKGLRPKIRLLQAGSKAVGDFVSQVAQQTPATQRPLSAVVVRHPLARLASAYRLP